MQNLGVPRLLGCGNWGVVCAKLSLLAYLEYNSPLYRGNKLGHCARCMALSLLLLYFEDVLWLISFYRGTKISHLRVLLLHWHAWCFESLFYT